MGWLKHLPLLYLLALASAAQAQTAVPLDDRAKRLDGNWQYSQESVSIAGRVCDRWGRPCDFVVFDVTGYERFVADVGIRDGTEQRAELSVLADGRPILEKGFRPGEAPEHLDLTLTGYRGLALVARGDALILLDPRIVKGSRPPSRAGTGSGGNAAGTPTPGKDTIATGDWEYRKATATLAGEVYDDWARVTASPIVFALDGCVCFRARVGVPGLGHNGGGRARLSVRIDGDLVLLKDFRAGQRPEVLDLALSGHHSMALGVSGDTLLFACPRFYRQVPPPPTTGRVLHAQAEGQGIPMDWNVKVVTGSYDYHDEATSVGGEIHDDWAQVGGQTTLDVGGSRGLTALVGIRDDEGEASAHVRILADGVLRTSKELHRGDRAVPIEVDLTGRRGLTLDATGPACILRPRLTGREFRVTLPAASDDDRDGWLRIAHLYEGLGQAEDARVAHRKAIVPLRRQLENAGSPCDRANAHNLLACALMDVRDYHEAAMHCRKAIGISPTYPSPHYNLAVCLKQLGKPSQAATSMTRYVRLLSADLRHPDRRVWIPRAKEFLRRLGR